MAMTIRVSLVARYGAARIGLDGNPAGTVNAEEAAVAAARLAGRKGKRRQVLPASIPAPEVPLGW